MSLNYRIGTIVRFELADTNTVMSGNRSTTVLSCETSSEVSSYCELLMGAAADKPEGRSHVQYSLPPTCLTRSLIYSICRTVGEPVTIRTAEWEVVPDSWISSDLEFLEKYLN
jgi:hypothetical protein